MIHSQAIVHPSARIAEDVEIGPWTIIGEHVEIGKGTTIASHVVIQGPTTIGEGNKVYQFASIGEVPQDKKYSGERTRLEIGDHNTFREFCTINRGTEQGGKVTKIGDHNLFMSYTHVAHDCDIANHVIFSNNASIAGHVSVGDYAILGGFVGVHQFCAIGAYSFAAAGSIITKDVLPYVKVSGYPAQVHGLNTIGLERLGYGPKTLAALRQAYKVIFRQNLTVPEAIELLIKMSKEDLEVQLFVQFLQESTRGIVR